MAFMIHISRFFYHLRFSFSKKLWNCSWQKDVHSWFWHTDEIDMLNWRNWSRTFCSYVSYVRREYLFHNFLLSLKIYWKRTKMHQKLSCHRTVRRAPRIFVVNFIWDEINCGILEIGQKNPLFALKASVGWEKKNIFCRSFSHTKIVRQLPFWLLIMVVVSNKISVDVFVTQKFPNEVFSKKQKEINPSRFSIIMRKILCEICHDFC